MYSFKPGQIVYHNEIPGLRGKIEALCSFDEESGEQIDVLDPLVPWYVITWLDCPNGRAGFEHQDSLSTTDKA